MINYESFLSYLVSIYVIVHQCCSTAIRNLNGSNSEGVCRTATDGHQHTHCQSPFVPYHVTTTLTIAVL